MSTKKEADECQPVKPQGETPSTIVSDGYSDVKRIRIKNGVSVTDMVTAVRTLYPRYDKTLHSKVENGDRYGICLRGDAEKLILRRFAGEPRKRPVSDRRKKPRRIQARVSETVYALLQQRISHLGITMQEFIENLIFEYIEREK